MFRVALGLSAAVAASSLSAQSIEAPVTLPNASSSDDVIVRALRIPRKKLPTAVHWDYQAVIPSRMARESADTFMRCALKSSDTAVIRKVVDGIVNSAEARFAQGWIVQTRQGCYRSVPAIKGSPNQPTTTIDLGDSNLDRGVVIEQVLTTYAPDASLNRSTVSDPNVRERFMRREQGRNRLRLKADWQALQIASCLVQVQPELATRLFRSQPGSQLERGLTQTIIVEGRQCVGAAKRLTIEPAFARIYIMDAFYRWVVAARGVASLIPTSA